MDIYSKGILTAITIYLVTNILQLSGIQTIKSANAACQGETCCSINSGIVTYPAFSRCHIEPDLYGIKIYKLYLCTSKPPTPTNNIESDLASSGCTIVLDSDSGSDVDLTQASEPTTFPNAIFTRPPTDIYTHGAMYISNTFRIKWARQFNQSVKSDSSASTGEYCSTTSGTGDPSDKQSLLCQSGSAPTAGIFNAVLDNFGNDTIEMFDSYQNINGSGADINAYLVNSLNNLSSNGSDATKIYGIQTLAAPVIISKNFKGLNISFAINKGSLIFQSGASSEIGASVGPFQTIITSVNH